VYIDFVLNLIPEFYRDITQLILYLLFRCFLLWGAWIGWGTEKAFSGLFQENHHQV